MSLLDLYMNSISIIFLYSFLFTCVSFLTPVLHVLSCGFRSIYCPFLLLLTWLSFTKFPPSIWFLNSVSSIFITFLCLISSSSISELLCQEVLSLSSLWFPGVVLTHNCHRLHDIICILYILHLGFVFIFLSFFLTV